jgi:hypothetical protein
MNLARSCVNKIRTIRQICVLALWNAIHFTPTRIFDEDAIFLLQNDDCSPVSWRGYGQGTLRGDGLP